MFILIYNYLYFLDNFKFLDENINIYYNYFQYFNSNFFCVFLTAGKTTTLIYIQNKWGYTLECTDSPSFVIKLV